MNCNNNKS